MERIVKISKTIRNNWKKSTFAAVVVGYAVNKAKEKYDINILMRAACKEAAKYGDVLIPMDQSPMLVTVILNPVANKRNAKQDFETYCEPILQLAGLQLNVIQTTAEGNAKEVMESLSGTEAIIVAGGDGTLSETVTGLLRRNDGANQFPLGVLPLGRTNTFGNTLFPGGDGVDRVKQLIDASMAIVKGNTTLKDAMKIEPIAQDNEPPNRPIFALSSVEWGAFRDTLARKDKYWFVGSLRDYASFLFNGYKESLTWDCRGTIKYTPPCSGCSNCIPKRPEIKTHWSFFMPANVKVAKEEERPLNPECLNVQELCFKSSEFKIRTPNIENNPDQPALKVVLGKNMYSYTEFVSEGWSRLKGNESENETVKARTIELIPESPKDGVVIEIDKEEFDVKPVRITLLPKIVKLFCNHQLNSI